MAGLGLLGLGLVLDRNIGLVDTAEAASVIKIADDKWNEVGHAQVFIDFKDVVPQVTLDTQILEFVPGANNSTSVMFIPGIEVSQGEHVYKNAIRFVLPDGALDSETNKRYNVYGEIDIHLHAFSDTLTPNYESVNDTYSTFDNPTEANNAIFYVTRRAIHLADPSAISSWVGADMYLSHDVRIKIVDDNNNVIHKTVSFVACDLDTALGAGRSVSGVQPGEKCDYRWREGITFTSDTGPIYVSNNNYLEILDGGKQIVATREGVDWPEDVSHEGYEPEFRFATYMLDGEFSFTWTGSNCNTAIFSHAFAYPDVPINPKKAAITPRVW